VKRAAPRPIVCEVRPHSTVVRRGSDTQPPRRRLRSSSAPFSPSK
jgi:hypothetical protein